MTREEPPGAEPVLSVSGLTVVYPGDGADIVAVRDVSFDLRRGEILGLIGESGAGKSTVAAAILGLVDAPGRIASGRVALDGEDLAAAAERRLRALRGRRIGAVFQDPLTALNPVLSVGRQMVWAIERVTDLRGAAARARAVELLDQVGLPEPRAQLRRYPHQLSGGMRQRVVIAIALCGDPDVLIADEPTTALDVSVQSGVLALIRRLCRERDLGVVLVTHDMAVMAQTADRLAVMRHGEILEIGPVERVLRRPEHPYVRQLIRAVPPSDRRLERFEGVGDEAPEVRPEPPGRAGASPARAAPDAPEGARGTAPAGTDPRPDARTPPAGAAANAAPPRRGPFSPRSTSADAAVEGPRPDGQPGSPAAEPALAVEGLRVVFPVARRLLGDGPREVVAVAGASFDVPAGQSFGVVGESGSGKSTLARAIVGLVAPSAGRVRALGQDVTRLHADRRLRRAVLGLQMIFQDPFSSLDPRQRVIDALTEPMAVHGLAPASERRGRALAALERVGLGPEAAERHPHEFSGGQRQRICIARALVMEPSVLICDEPTSALDVSVQARILNLLKDLQAERRLTLLFISHDLAVVRQMCDRVAVMARGEIVETAPTEALFDAPRHAVTRGLLERMPRFEAAG